MRRAKRWRHIVVALGFLLPLTAPRAWAIDLGSVAPDFKAYEEVSEEDMQFYPYIQDRVTLLWIWDWKMGCPI